MTRSPRTRDLHVQLYRVHAQDLVAHVGQHVARGDDPGPRGQLHQLLQLRAPLCLIRQVAVGPELDHSSRRPVPELDDRVQAFLRVAAVPGFGQASGLVIGIFRDCGVRAGGGAVPDGNGHGGIQVLICILLNLVPDFDLEMEKKQG